MGPVFLAFGCFKSVPISEFWSGTERISVFPSPAPHFQLSKSYGFFENEVKDWHGVCVCVWDGGGGGW